MGRGFRDLRLAVGAEVAVDFAPTVEVSLRRDRSGDDRAHGAPLGFVVVFGEPFLRAPPFEALLLYLRAVGVVPFRASGEEWGEAALLDARRSSKSRSPLFSLP